MSNEKNNNTGTKAFAGVLVILAVIAGVFAMVQPMTQRINQLERQINTLADHQNLDNTREREDQSKFAASAERFKEVETQFSGLENRIQKIEDWRIWWNRTILKRHGAVDARVRDLEKEVDTLRGHH